MGLDYFSQIGFKPPPNENACDFFMDVVRKEGGRQAGRSDGRTNDVEKYLPLSSLPPLASSGV
jgi:hypothetical protein